MTDTDTATFLQNTLLFTRMLGQAGLPVSVEQTSDFTRALALVDIGSRDEVYYAAQSMLVTRHEHLRLFETLFNRFWRMSTMGAPTGQKMPLAPRHKRPTEKRYDIVNLMARKAQAGDQEIEIADKANTFSAAELLQHKAFSAMTPEELETVKQLVQKMQWPVSLRRTRRWVPHKQGNMLYLRQVMRAAAKYNGVPIQLTWQKRKVKERPFVFIADISGSMEKYARLTLQFFYSVTHSFKDVECFVFGTRLTRITPQLKLKHIDRAIDEAAREVFDWAGGTRIGESLKAFNQEWSRRVLRRGAVVLVISDGWERGDVSLLAKEMRYLQHRCHRLIWLNPLAGRDAYRPVVEGMAAALPYIDDFLPIHNLQSLSAIADHLASIGKYRTVPRMPES